MLAAPEGFAPLSGWDAFPIHQSVTPIRFVDTTDPRAFEHYWFTAQAKNPAFFLVFGMGFYPSLGVADAYVLLTRRDRQVTVLRYTHTYVTAFLRCAAIPGRTDAARHAAITTMARIRAASSQAMSMTFPAALLAEVDQALALTLRKPEAFSAANVDALRPR